MKRIVESSKTPNNGGFPNNYRQPDLLRHTAPNSYGGAPPESGRYTPLNLRGPHPASTGNPNKFVRPPGYRNNFHRPPHPSVSSVEIRRIRPEIVRYNPPNNDDLYSNQLHLNNHLMSDL